mmetsp:Transcript_19098/g.40021  ORF Transcript_19098/g.40021 Transcript_19098/m.40021 type:complete len:242 (+) Transcript_19098:1953-2678(+)
MCHETTANSIDVMTSPISDPVFCMLWGLTRTARTNPVKASLRSAGFAILDMPSHHPSRNLPSSGATNSALTEASLPIVVAAFSAMPGRESSFPSMSTALPINSGMRDATRSAAWGISGPAFSPQRTHTSPTAHTALLHVAGCTGSMDDIASDRSWGSPASIRLGVSLAKSPNSANALIRTPLTKCSATLCSTFWKVGPNRALPFTNAAKFGPNPSTRPSIRSTAQTMGSVMSSSMSSKSSS